MGGPALDHGGVGQVAFEVEEALCVRFIRSTSEARALHATDACRIVGLGTAEHLPYAVCRELRRDRPRAALPQAATSAIRGNDESESGGPVLVDLDIDQAHRCIVLLNHPGAPVEDLVPAMLPWRPRGQAQDH